MERNKELLDSETVKTLDRAEHVKAMTQSQGWAIAKELFNAKILELGNILTVAGGEPVKVSMEIGARQEAMKILLEFLREIEGQAASYEDMLRSLTNERDNDYVVRRD